MEVSGFLRKDPVHWCYIGSSQSFRQSVKHKLSGAAAWEEGKGAITSTQ